MMAQPLLRQLDAIIRLPFFDKVCVCVCVYVACAAWAHVQANRMRRQDEIRAVVRQLEDTLEAARLLERVVENIQASQATVVHLDVGM